MALEVKFTPELPADCDDDAYLDTSILRILALFFDHDIGKAIFKKICGLKGKRVTSDYVIFELKRSCITPIWELYMNIFDSKSVQNSILQMNQAFGVRACKTENDIMNCVLQKMAADGTAAGESYELFLARLESVAKDIEANITKAIHHCVANQTGCKLHKPSFDIKFDFPASVECKCECNVDDFWKAQKSKTKRVAEFDIKTLSGKDQDWFKENQSIYADVNKNPVEGKTSKNCIKLSDGLILLHTKKDKVRVLSSDHSHVAIAKATGHKVHKMNSVSAILGGSAKKTAKAAFDKMKSSDQT